MTGGSDPVLFEKEGAIAWVTLNRPDALNAINLQMRDRFWEIFQAIRDDPDIGVAIIRGAGERAFCAGADIKEFGTAPSYIAARSARYERDVWSLLLHLSKPVIAAVHGFAYGGGCELSLYCDIRIASEDARFGLPELLLAYLPSAGGTQMMPRTVPPGVALGMILSGEPIDALEALRLGLVQRVVARERLFDEAREIASILLRHPPATVRYAKEAIGEGLSMPLDQGLALEARLAMLSLADARQGLGG